MAKSLRSKSKLAARNARRHDPKSDYAVIAAARLAQVTERLHGGGGRQFKDTDGEEKEEEEGGEGEERARKEEEVEKMEVEGEVKKISTSGTRQNRRETWRAAKGWKPKKSQGAGFFGGASKNGGKTKRRR